MLSFNIQNVIFTLRQQNIFLFELQRESRHVSGEGYGKKK